MPNIYTKNTYTWYIKFRFWRSKFYYKIKFYYKKELCYWNENGVEDYDMWLRLRKLNKKFYNCPQILVKHRIHKQSAFNSKKNNDKVPELLKSHGF